MGGRRSARTRWNAAVQLALDGLAMQNGNTGDPSEKSMHQSGSSEASSAERTRFVVQPTIGESITSEMTRNTYTIGNKIGEGAFGIVYHCTDVWSNELAVKVLKPRGSYEKVRDAAVSEFQKLLALRHPNVTYIHDAFEYRDTFYIVTELCHWPISELFTTVTGFQGSLWLKPIARCLLQAVNYLHINNVAHQDIHCGNVLSAFVRDEMVPDTRSAIVFKLGDLGVARVFDELSPSNTRAIWMLPPEVIDTSEFGPIDKRIDIYHCGLLFLSVAHGKELRFTQEEILAGAPRKMALELDSTMSFALEKALRRHVQYRTENAMEFWRDLNTKALP
jgi:eukaryotic-like serine/threonine-protein kinase